MAPADRELGAFGARLTAAERILEQIAADVRYLRERDAAAVGSRRTVAVIASSIGGVIGASASVLASYLHR